MDQFIIAKETIIKQITNSFPDIDDFYSKKEDFDSLATAKNKQEFIKGIIKLYDILENQRSNKDEMKNFISDSFKSRINLLTKAILPSLENFEEFEKVHIWDFVDNDHVFTEYFSYAIYSKMNNKYEGSIESHWEYMNNGTESDQINEYHGQTYLSLVRYFKKATLRFSDNIDAVTLLQKHYPKNNNFSKTNQDNIAEVLYLHFRLCGTKGDIGYAYGGIDLIREHIENIPELIIEVILSYYDISRLISDSVCRHQLYTIIDSHPKISEKEYKFKYLDGSMLMDIITNGYAFNSVASGLFSFNKVDYKLGDPKAEVDISYIDSKNNFIEKKYVWVIENTNFTLYTNGSNHKLLEFELNILQNNIKFTFSRDFTSDIGFFTEKYDKSDWKLTNLMGPQLRKKLEEYISHFTFNRINEIEEKEELITSYIYINNFRGIKRDVSITFNDEYCYQFKDDILSREKNDIINLYGKNIKSLTAVVGKNGTGKTSIITFIKEVLFPLLKRIEKSEVFIDENGYVNEFIDECSFIAVFEYKGKSYFLSNKIKLQKKCDLISYKRGILKQSEQFMKINYFSNSVNLYKNPDINLRRGSSELDNLIQDYSEQIKFFEAIEKLYGRKRSYEDYFQSVNEMVRTFVDVLKGKNITKKKQIFNSASKLLNNFYEEIKGSIDEGSEGSMSIQYDNLSSGQLSRLIFLSKFYWCVSGKSNSEKQTPKNSIQTLLIDEGDLYYHPDWQREFLFILLFLIDLQDEGKFQIILTTNSPFIISDVLSKDIVYLPQIENQSPSFGQNIHVLLSEEFFMNYTIGEFSLKNIEFIIDNLYELLKESSIKENPHILSTIIRKIKSEYCLPEDNTVGEVFGYLNKLINQIGEKIYRNQLLNMLEKCKELYLVSTNEKENINRMILENKEKLIELETKLRDLERDGHDYDTNEKIFE